MIFKNADYSKVCLKIRGFGIKSICDLMKVALDAGFEPATKWLTATYSTAELIQNEIKSAIIN